MDQWYHQKQGKVVGPLSPHELRSLVDRGEVSPGDHVSTDGSTWVMAGNVKGLFPTEPSSLASPSSGRGRSKKVAIAVIGATVLVAGVIVAVVVFNGGFVAVAVFIGDDDPDRDGSGGNSADAGSDREPGGLRDFRPRGQQGSLFPPVAQAREAARRTQSKDNLHNIGLGIWIYAEARREELPQGTIPNERLAPEERLSWMVNVLPYLDHLELYERINLDEGWEHESNADALHTEVPAYSHPSALDRGFDPYEYTHYVGVAGLGADGPTLPVDDPRAGVFAYDRVTRISNITDGLSNTLMVGEAGWTGPWGRGGPSTIRPFTETPYINGSDGFGGYHQGGCNFLFCDGAVRFISEEADDSIMEGMATICGDEVIGEF